MSAPRDRHPSLLQQIVVRLFLGVLLAALAAMVVYVAVRPIELEYELEELAREFRGRIVDRGREDGRRVLELEVDERLYDWLARIPDLHLRIYDPKRRAVLFSFDHDRATAGVITPLLSWPPGFFELYEGSEGETEYGYVERLVLADGHELRFVVRRGPPELRDYLHWIAVEFGYELLPAFLAVVTTGSLAAALAVRRTMRPLLRLSALASRLDPAVRAELPTRDVPVEVLPLVEAVNRLLARLHDLLERQRRFSAFAAHELRTPLAALRARAEALPPELPERAVLLRAIGRTERLVDSLLALARIGKGLVVPEEETDLRQVVAEVAEEFAPAAVERGVEFEVELPDVPVPAWIHRDSLVRAIANLLDNALKYGAGGGSITLSLDPEGRILVRDRGPGLPEGDGERLFEPFVRRRPRGEDPGGSGLGLAFVREVAELHDGEVIARNAEGGGAVVGLRIPVHKPAKA